MFDKERQNEIYLEAAIRTERCDAAVRQRRVGERGGRLAVPKQGRVGIARDQIRARMSRTFCIVAGLLVVRVFIITAIRGTRAVLPTKSAELTEKASVSNGESTQKRPG